MPASDAMSCEQLARLIGLPVSPTILDLRREALRAAEPGPARRPCAGRGRSDLRRADGDAFRPGRRGPRQGPPLEPGRAAHLRHAGACRPPGSPLAFGGSTPPRSPRDPCGCALWSPGRGPGSTALPAPADPPLHRPRRGRSLGCPLRRHALRHPGRLLKPPGRDLHLQHDPGRARPVGPGLGPAGADRARGRYGAAGSSPGKSGVACGLAGPVADVCRRPGGAGRRHGA